MIAGIFGSPNAIPDLSGSHLIIPCNSAGQSPFIALDLLILNEPSVQKIGHYKSVNIAPCISNDGTSLQPSEGQITLPAEIYYSKELNLTILFIRSGVQEGRMRKYGDELVQFAKQHGFASVNLISSTLSPIARERDSNRLIPEIFGYVNNYIYKQKNPKYYEVYGIRRFGYWLKDTKIKHHQELDELMMAGSAKGLIKTFNRQDIPCTLFVIFTSGGIDFVGGYTYYQFIKNFFSGNLALASDVYKKFGKLQLSQKDGEEIHEMLFQKKALKIPFYCLGKNEKNLLSLQHSALDISPKLFNFASWLNSSEFINPSNTSSIHGTTPALNVNFSLAFQNFNHLNGMGYGIKSLQNITQGDTIIKQKTTIGLISKDLHDEGQQILEKSVQDQLSEAQLQDLREEESLEASIQRISKEISELFFPGDFNKVNQNKLYQHLMLTQKLLMIDRKQFTETASDQLMQAYLDIVPRDDMSTLIYWNRKVLNEIDSETLRSQFQQTEQYYQSIYHHLVNLDSSPYKGKNSLTLDQFLWAFTTISQRHLVMMNQQLTNDPNMIMLLVPLFDMLNHSQEPNVIITPYEDKITNESFVLLQAIKDIQKDEQLCISYGSLGNSHLIQKYGFTLENNPQNSLTIQLPFHEHQGLIFEEIDLKRRLSAQHRVPFSEHKYISTLYPARFNQDQLKQLRLSFFTSRNIIDLGGTDRFIQTAANFSQGFSEDNEDFSFDYLVKSLQSQYMKLKPLNYYQDQIKEIESRIFRETSLDGDLSAKPGVQVDNALEQYNMMNAFRLQADESKILSANIEFLKKNHAISVSKLIQV
ncbi:set domain protein [Stylonychia lemnae]|uniref:Set domain protein n=1 Tax=Stylonychia lemnae TaxID=5949 RepID=A0A078AXI5_STYLE|nr:set domain protein [Stylonychia lemnae]|eukprot:CDW87175.1 set domain protein [Stylonychia lemnae]